MTKKEKIEMLEKKKKQALANANRQQRAVDASKFTKKYVRTRPEFWHQAARDYEREIELLKNPKKKVKN